MPSADVTSNYIMPLVVGVTGHRDLVPTEIDALENSIHGLFSELTRRFPHCPIVLMSALAEGADRLAAKVALQAGANLQVVLPMPASMYCDDFGSASSIDEFNDLCTHAEVFELSMPDKHTSSSTPNVSNRDLAYANAGMFISAHCHILLALWDGTQSQNVGGTAQIIYFQHYDRLPGLAESVPRTSLFLTDDESDLVYHIPCARLQSDKDRQPEFATAEASWFTADTDAPRMPEMPARYVRVFNRIDDFNKDVANYLKTGTPPTADEFDPPPTEHYESARRIATAFGIADALADHFQTRVGLTLRTIHVFAILTGLAFILYSEFSQLDALILVFLALLLTGIALAAIAGKRQWHRKYLDYRVLAEGLRVQFYWAVAGVRDQGQTKFAYDNFLRQRDMDLGWIRNIMRVAGTYGDSKPSAINETGLQFAMDNWIGDDNRKGQLSYYRVKAAQRKRINQLTSRLASLCLWSGIMVATILAFFLDENGENNRKILIILMGVLPLIAAVTEAYTQRKANSELAKQYQFMEHVFGNARRRLDESTSVGERREVLQGLGDAALTEHAEWILIHRERRPESGGI